MKTECKHSLDVSPSGHMASCKLCGFVGRWRDGVWEKVEEPASATPAPAAPHTPGPWKVAGIAWEVASGVWTRHIHTPEFVRGVVLGHQARGRTEVEVEANARLIAAAPDLLAACEAAVFGANHIDCVRAMQEVLPQIRSAIAKAKGGVA